MGEDTGKGSREEMKVVVVGGGLLGLSTGYYLARAGHRVTVLEASGQLGGLATDVEVAGTRIDRFYHCILNADRHLLGLIDEVGLRDELRMHPVRAGFHTAGKTSPISTPLDLLRFPPLGLIDRLRLVRSLLACQRVKNWHALERIDVESWLRRLSGDHVFQTVWRPLLSAKFDGNFAATPATYIWSRTVRMTDTRSAGGTRELAGHLGGIHRSGWPTSWGGATSQRAISNQCTWAWSAWGRARMSPSDGRGHREGE